MAIKDRIHIMKEKYWKWRIPKEYKDWPAEKIIEKYTEFYDELASKYDDPAFSRSAKDKFLMDHANLIKTIQIHEKKLKDPRFKTNPHRKSD